MDLLKKMIKKIISFIRHPILSLYLHCRGSKNVIIGARTIIRRIHYLYFGNEISIGNDARFLFVPNYCDIKYDPKLVIGNNVSIGNRFSALSAAPIYIGSNSLIASDVLITSENHGSNIEQSNNYGKLPLVAKPVSIGEGCWIGEKVSIMPGVSLGKRCIVAANAVVTKSVPDYCMVAGIPARIIKKYNFETHGWENLN